MKTAKQRKPCNHNQSSIIIEASVFVHAVRLANEVPFDLESVFQKKHAGMGVCEHHPAMRMLCDSWNRFAKKSHASYCMPWVQYGAQYACGYVETPPQEAQFFRKNRSSIGRVSGCGKRRVVLEFFRGTKDFTYDGWLGLQTYLVSGERRWTTTVDEKQVKSGEHDESGYGLQALKEFPARFPKEWAALTARAHEAPRHPALRAGALDLRPTPTTL